MRVWSLHPQYLDRQGLTSAWREALLAQAVLAGRTRGYTRHPQLQRFRETRDAVAAMGAVLTGLHTEASARGYRFDLARVDRPDAEGLWTGAIPVTEGQLALEWQHLLTKLQVRSPDLARRWCDVVPVLARTHPVFRPVPGPVATWERARG